MSKNVPPVVKQNSCEVDDDDNGEDGDKDEAERRRRRGGRREKLRERVGHGEDDQLTPRVSEALKVFPKQGGRHHGRLRNPAQPVE